MKTFLLLVLLTACLGALSLLPPGEGEPGWIGWSDGRCDNERCATLN